MLRSYKGRWLPKDLVAGLILTALLVPQGMAYAELAGLPPITGLVHIDPLPGRLRVLWSIEDPGARARLIARAHDRGHDSSPDRRRWRPVPSRLPWPPCWRLLVGAITTLAGLAKLGFVADLLSKPTMIGYMNGLAVTILVGQLPKLFGFSVEGDTFIAELRGFVDGLFAR